MIIAIRPEPGASATVATGAALGLAVTAIPLFAIHPLAWDAPPPEQFDALLIGSANALPLAAERYRALPVHAVGEATAQAAREAGFAVAATGKGNLQAVLDQIPPPARLLRLAGAERIALSPPPGITITERVTYESVALAMPGAFPVKDAVVLLHSAIAARHFALECDRLGLARDGIALAALAPRIAYAADNGWAAVTIAAKPTDIALLASARDLCQTCAPKGDATSHG